MTTIITKNNTLAGVVPAPGELEIGELAVNTADRKLWTKNLLEEVVELTNQGTGGSGDYIPLAGTVSPDWVTGDVTWQHSITGDLWSIGVLEGTFDDYITIGANSGNLGNATGIGLLGQDGAGGANNFWFQGDGVAVLPKLVVSDSTNDPLTWDALIDGNLGVVGGVYPNFVEALTLLQSDTMRILTDAHIGGTASPAPYKLLVTGDIGLTGSIFSGAIFNNTGIETVTLKASDKATFGSTTDAGSNAIRVDGNSDLNGSLNVSGVLTATNTGGNNITNLTMNNFVVISAMAGGGNRYVRVDNNGTLYASAT